MVSKRLNKKQTILVSFGGQRAATPKLAAAPTAPASPDTADRSPRLLSASLTRQQRPRQHDIGITQNSDESVDLLIQKTTLLSGFFLFSPKSVSKKFCSVGRMFKMAYFGTSCLTNASTDSRSEWCCHSI
jgi:hypothetical protein